MSAGGGEPAEEAREHRRRGRALAGGEDADACAAGGRHPEDVRRGERQVVADTAGVRATIDDRDADRPAGVRDVDAAAAGERPVRDAERRAGDAHAPVRPCRSYQVAVARRKTVAIAVTGGAALAATARPVAIARAAKRPATDDAHVARNPPPASATADVTVCHAPRRARSWTATLAPAAPDPSVPANSSG